MNRRDLCGNGLDDGPDRGGGKGEGDRNLYVDPTRGAFRSMKMMCVTCPSRPTHAARAESGTGRGRASSPRLFRLRPTLRSRPPATCARTGRFL